MAHHTIRDEEEDRQAYESLWYHALIGLAYVAQDGTFKRANPAMQRIVGYTEAELQSRRFQDITVPGDVVADEIMADKVARGEVDHYDMNKGYIHKLGHIVPVRLRVVGLHSENGFEFFVSQMAEIHQPLVTVPPAMHGGFHPMTAGEIKWTNIGTMVWRDLPKWAIIVGMVSTAIAGAVVTLNQLGII